MYKKLLGLGIAMALSVSMMACGSSQTSTKETAAATTAAAAAGADAAAPAASDVKLPKSIEIQVPAKAGGGTDVMARALGQEVATQSGSNTTVVNNTDGGGVVAMETVRTAKGDGSKILQFHTSMLIKTGTGIYKHSAAEDFKVIGVAAGVEKAQYIIVTAATSGIDTLDKFLEKGKSGEIKVGIESGGTTHILTGILAKAAGIQVKYVESGSDTEKLTALVGNTIDACIVNTNQAKQYVESGKANAIAVISNGETGSVSSLFPDVKSVSDQGIDCSFTTYNFILGPKDMDEALAKGLYDYYAAAAKSDAVNTVLEPAGMKMEFLPYEDGVAAIQEQQTAINSVVEELGLKK